ncbi:MAG: type secretion system protein [Dehalococcoidia bacterium]|nr:type secretion system protein [Dehalococcoidia bacterium]
MPLAIQEEELMVATSEPQDIAALGDLQAATRKKIRPTLAIKAHIDQTINRYYKLTDSICAQIASATEAAIRVGPGDPNATAVVQIVQLVIAQAVREWASDVYFEPRDGEVQVRFRVNGQLRDSIKLPGPLQAPLVRRIKVMSKIDSGEARQLQEGRFSMKVGETQTEVRVTIVTTDKGDLVALRLLDDANTILPLKQLGFWPAALEAYTKVLDRPFGLVLISGPSGSGKTTTLFASLQHFTERNRDVVTVEEPVEYRLPTIKQIQVNDHGTTAADAINNALRLSPDVLLVSDIREASTARAVLRAASTGHLVLSCIEANDTVSALFRFKDLDVDLRLLAPDLTGCVYQRLVRRICPYCRQAYQPSPEEMAAFRRITSQDTGEFYKGVGCNFCDQSGYMGLAGLFEVLPVSNDIKTLLSKGASYGEIREQAIKEGMVTIQQDGMLKAAQGTTTIAEFMRVIPFLES